MLATLKIIRAGKKRSGFLIVDRKLKSGNFQVLKMPGICALFRCKYFFVTGRLFVEIWQPKISADI